MRGVALPIAAEVSPAERANKAEFLRNEKILVPLAARSLAEDPLERLSRILALKARQGGEGGGCKYLSNSITRPFRTNPTYEIPGSTYISILDIYRAFYIFYRARVSIPFTFERFETVWEFFSREKLLIGPDPLGICII